MPPIMLWTTLALVVAISVGIFPDKRGNLSKNLSTKISVSPTKIYANAIVIIFRPHNFYVEILYFILL
jgi:hypothetical protein